MDFLLTSKITARAQTTIPKVVSEALDLRPDDRMA
jgi:bifunctional DNA-binding transcriptional regulator/antitoxin component of YhaV-PrlF toxin-antitoxin module